MFSKYKQSSKSQKKFSDLQRHQTVSFPIIKFATERKGEKSNEKDKKIVMRYKSQRKYSFAENNIKSIKNILNPIKQIVEQKVQKNHPVLSSYASVQITQKVQQKQFLTSRSNQIYKSPPKRRKVQNLPHILAQGDFIKRNQNSVDTSQQEEMYKKQIFQPEFNPLRNEQRKFIKEQETFKKANIFDQVIAKKLRVQERDKIQTIKLLKQVQNSIVRNQFHSQKQKQAISKLSSYELQYKNEQLVGPQAVQKFYLHYKKIDRIKQIEQIKKKSNPLTIILTILQSYNIPPKRMDIIKNKGAQSILDLNHIGLGQSISTKAISQILESLKHFEEINLSYNSISFDRIDIIIPNLRGLRKIDLSHNRIGKKGADLLAQIIITRKNHLKSQQYDQDDKLLEQLNLQQNGLPDTGLNLFLIKAKVFENIKILNLNRNFLGNNFALRMKEFLIDEKNLDELYLHWNDITSKGMKSIFEGLSLNINLKVLDLSWNQIGFEAIPAISNFFRKNNTLLHLDISNCNVNMDDSKTLSESIKLNNSILGLHFEGNQGFIDSCGFILPRKEKEDNLVSLRNQILIRMKGVQRSNFNKDRYEEGTQLKKCWICDGWQQRTIDVIKLKQSDIACCIHFDFDNFKGIPMEQVQGNYHLRKMLPLRKVRFFITKINKKKQFIHQATMNFNPTFQFHLIKLEQTFKVERFYIQTKQFNDIELKEINVIDLPNQQQKDMFQYEYEYQFSCKPRTGAAFIDHSLFVQPQHPVTVKKKIKVKKQRNKQNDKKVRQLPQIQNYFKQTEINPQKNKNFAQKCISFDLENSKIKKLISSKEEIQRIYGALQENYQTFLNVYRYLSSSAVNSVTSIYFISETRLESFLDFMHFQTKTLTRAKIRIKMYAALSLNDQFSKSQQKNNQIEERLFNRPQFFQFLLRIAIEKYSNNKTKKQQQMSQGISISQGFKQLLVGLKRYQSFITLPSKWRSEHLHTYDISLVVKSYEHFIQSIYNHYTGIFQKNMSIRLQKKMLLNQFKQIFLDSGVKKSRQSLKDAELAFIQSKQIQIQQGMKQYGLTFNEFLQALIRMAHVNNFKPIGTEQYKLWQKIEDINTHHQKRQFQNIDFTIPLFLKFQALLKRIHTENRQVYRSKNMDRIFKKGLFPDEIQMMVEIFKQRLQEIHRVDKERLAQPKKKSIKFNSLFNEEQNAKKIDNNKIENRHSKKLTLEYLLEELRIKFKKLSQELDRNYIEYDEISQAQDNNSLQLDL